MRRLCYWIGSSILVLTAGSVDAGWNEFWNRVHVDFHRMNCWPEPFTNADRVLVKEPFCVNVDAGWRSEHTLSDHLFVAESHQLTVAGQLKAKWIATQAPVHRRTIFVVRGMNDDVTHARILAVQAYLSQRALPTGMPPIVPTDLEPLGGSGDYYDAIDRRARESLPEPRLPQMQIIGGGGGGS